MKAAPENETVGLRIRRLRAEKRLSLQQIAGPGAGVPLLSRVESGKRKATLNMIRAVAPRLGVTPEYLETGQDFDERDERAWKLAEAELVLRIGQELETAETSFREVVGGAQVPTAIVARAHAGLGLLAARRAQHADVVRHLEQATSFGCLGASDRADVYEALAVAYAATGVAARAVTLLDSCLEEVDREPAETHVAVAIRYRSTLAAVLASTGAVDRARSVLLEAIERAEGHDLPHARVGLYLAAARVAWMASDSHQALELASRASGIVEGTEDTLQLARVRVAIATIANLEGDHEQAGRYLAEAEPLLAVAGNRDDWGCLRSEEAKVAAATGDADRALALAREAVAIFATDDRHPGGFLALAVAFVANGDLDAAGKAFTKSIDRLADARQWREAAHAAQTWATALREAGRADEALDVLQHALSFSVRETARSGA